MGSGYQFSDDAARRIAKVVRRIEGQGESFGGGRMVRAVHPLPTAFGKLTSKSGTLYAWTESKPDSSGAWATISSGLSGTTSSFPAVDPDSSGYDLTGNYVSLVRGVFSDTKAPCWIIVKKRRITCSDCPLGPSPNNWTLVCSGDSSGSPVVNGTFTITRQVGNNCVWQSPIQSGSWIWAMYRGIQGIGGFVHPASGDFQLVAQTGATFYFNSTITTSDCNATMTFTNSNGFGGTAVVTPA